MNTVLSSLLFGAAMAFSSPSALSLTSGTVTDQGVECIAFRSDEGQLITVPNMPSEIEPGDRITVEGEFLQGSFCQQGLALSADTVTLHKADGSEKVWRDLRG